MSENGTNESKLVPISEYAKVRVLYIVERHLRTFWGRIPSLG